jgi:inosine triphosphate pyrophosphatase
MMKEILFITGNDEKFREFQEILTKVELVRKKIDLPELQGTPEEIVTEKAQLAAKITGKPCFVDDTSLCFNEWGDLPGPYIKDFLKYMGNEKLSQTLVNSTDNHKAKALTSIGYCEPGEKAVCIQGFTEGNITLPRGENNFKKGWDQIFSPGDDERTYAEMTSQEKHSFSQRMKAIKKFEEFLGE